MLVSDLKNEYASWDEIYSRLREKDSTELKKWKEYLDALTQQDNTPEEVFNYIDHSVQKYRDRHSTKHVRKIQRNELCPCGSGLKYKRCKCKEYHPF